MFGDYQICPYTGLRSFTEEEAIYFKGREADIDLATGQLQRNKFLMLTGASGDGKSSLVYAGMIPNARAGFLKSKYTSWCVAGFRPERNPFDNLCRAVATQLEIENPDSVKAELSHGFSALVDLYKNSKRFIETDSIGWQRATEAERTIMKREAANFIILVDQFEEFFTNPENYQHGAPSKDASLVVNLLLETARISLDEDLPVYVIFTMRSDYVGQCADFRGLPEYIGFSQFFVPRLNRSQLQQVIEEPAELSGNRITRRLTERLIHDLTEGVDQLPILQHALNQIWVAAANGTEEMDLIHYAMVGGMSADELTDDQVQRFRSWFETLPSQIQSCYHTPNLQNVLDTHTNKLYEQAAVYYQEKTGNPISDEDAKLIIKTAFTCLTKIDKGRAVRNRMTLQEITHIFGNPAFDASRVGSLLNIFREPGNTFIHPFIYEEFPESRQLQAEQVLDITHESLIRNWQWLGQWAREEFDSYSVSLDFEKQLDRWVASGKSDAFLLSIGPLTYFENWFKKSRPNAWHVARYLPREVEEKDRIARAKLFLSNANDFLRRSASKHVITRTLMRYGARRIAIVIGIISLITLTSFGIRDYLRKQNQAVLKSMDQEALALVTNPKLGKLNKISVICEELKQKRITVHEVLDPIKDTVQQASIANSLGSMLNFQGLGEPASEIRACLGRVDSLLNSVAFPEKNSARLSALLTTMNDYRVTLELNYVYKADSLTNIWIHRNAKREADWVLRIAKEQPAEFDNIMEFTLAMENALNYKAFTAVEIDNLLSLLSPFENQTPSSWINKNFKSDKIMSRGELGYGFLFNGLYQDLAYLYAASGNSEMTLRCMDSLLKYSQVNYQGDYSLGADNATNILSVYFTNAKTEQLDAFVKGYCTRKNVTEEYFYQTVLGRMLRERSTMANLDLFWWMGSKTNLNLRFARRGQLGFFFNKYRQVVQALNGSADEKNFLTAVSYKNEGILKSVTMEPKGPGDGDPAEYFNQAMTWYEKVSPAYLEEPERMVGAGAVDEAVTARKALFIYPDYRTSFHPSEPRSFFYFSFSDAFLEFLENKGLMEKLFTGDAEWAILGSWIGSHNVGMFARRSFMARNIKYEVLQKLAEAYDKSRKTAIAEINLLYLDLGLQAQRLNRTEEMVEYYNKITPDNLPDLLRVKEYGGNVNHYTFSLIGQAIKGLYKKGEAVKARQILTTFKMPINRSSLYAFTARELMKEKYEGPLIQEMIDSSMKELSRAGNLTTDQPNREVLANALALQSPENNKEVIAGLIRNLPGKNSAFQDISMAYAFRNKIYEARKAVPALISKNDQADFLWLTLFSYADGNLTIGPEWKNFNEGYRPFTTGGLRYVDENN